MIKITVGVGADELTAVDETSSFEDRLEFPPALLLDWRLVVESLGPMVSVFVRPGLLLLV